MRAPLASRATPCSGRPPFRAAAPVSGSEQRLRASAVVLAHFPSCRLAPTPLWRALASGGREKRASGFFLELRAPRGRTLNVQHIPIGDRLASQCCHSLSTVCLFSGLPN